jgi:hypothetical protein
MMYKKQNRLAMIRENLTETDVIEIKGFSCYCDGEGHGKKRGENRGENSVSY